MEQSPLVQALNTAIAHHQAGRFGRAEAIYRQILARDPNQPDALHLLGILALEAKRPDAAVELIGRAVALRPNHYEAHNNLGNALAALGRLDEAVASFQRALALKRDFADALYNLANTLT